MEDLLTTVEVALYIVRTFVEMQNSFGGDIPIDSEVLMDSRSPERTIPRHIKPEDVLSEVRKYTTWDVEFERIEGGYKFVFYYPKPRS